MGNKVSISKDELESIQSESQLSVEAIKDLSKEFNKVCDRKGQVTKENFKAILRQAYGSDNSTMAASIFKMFDTDGSGSIDFREFVMALSFMHSDRVEDVVELCFRCLDLNGDGEISKGEMRAVFELQRKFQKYTNLSRSDSSQALSLDKVSLVYSDVGKLNNESDAIFARIDVNGDGGITRDEFMAAMSADPELRAKMQGLLMKSQVNTIFKGSTSKVAH